MDKFIIKAVHEGDLTRLLESLGILDQFNRGEIKCLLCGDVISKENLGALFPSDGNVGVCCSKPECYMNIKTKER